MLVWSRRKSMAAATRDNVPPAKETFAFLLYSLTFLAASVYAVAQPQRFFRHYALFLIVPSGFAAGVVLGELRKTCLSGLTTGRFTSITVRLISTGCVAVSALQLGMSLVRENRFIERRHQFREKYVSPVAEAILQHGSAGDVMAIWGWSPGLHVQTGLIQATSESIPIWQSRPNPQQAFFVKRYADELRRSNAKLFVDTQMSYEWLGVRGQEFEELPEIAEIVDRDFKVVSRIAGATIYARK
jgi:hypothetical protein